MAPRIGRVGPLQEIGIGALNDSATVEPVEDDPVKQVAVLIYTSGTTGTPKGVMLTHDNLLISARTTAHIRKMDEDDKIYLVLPISHIVGISLLIMTLMVGGTVRLVSKYDPAAAAKAIAEEGITILNGVPATYQRLLEYKSVAGLKQLDRGRIALDCGGRRAARSRSEIAGRERVRLAASQRLRHHRMLAGDIRRALRCAAHRSGRGHAAAGSRSPCQDNRRHTAFERAKSANFTCAAAT